MSTHVGMVTSTLDHGLTGPNQVLLNICKEINSRELPEFQFKYIHNEPSNLPIYTPENEVIVPRAPGWFERSLMNLNLDIVYYPHFPKLRPGFFFLDAAKVVHLHGDLPYALPSLVPRWSRYKQYALAAFYRWTRLNRRVDAYLAASDSLIKYKKYELGLSDSEFTKVELAPGISVDEVKNDDISSTLDAYGIEKEYILDVASTGEVKNVETLIRAVHYLHRRGVNTPQLVVAGDWKGSRISRLGNRLLGDDICFTGFIKGDELTHLYQDALLYVNPSLHETFGMTNLEAMAFGLPVITTNEFAIPEVVGDGALLVNDPKDSKELANKIKYLLENEEERRELAQKAKERASQFTWEKTVDKIISAFRTLS